MKKNKINKDKLLKVFAVIFTALFFLGTVGIIATCFQFDTSALNENFTNCPATGGLHIMSGGTCTECGYSPTCTHSNYTVYYDSSSTTHKKYCSNCYTLLGTTAHTFSSGVCSICKYSCAHDFRGSATCKLCGVSCSHSPTQLYISNKTATSHTLYCSYCDIAMKTEKHRFTSQTSTECIDCGYICDHDFRGSATCKLCGVVCSHAPVQMYTGNKTATSHTLYCSYCDIVMKTENHRFIGSEPSECIDCGFHCAHELGFNNGLCVVCENSCFHDGKFSYVSNDSLYHNSTCLICYKVTVEPHQIVISDSHEVSCTHCSLVLHQGLPTDSVKYFSGVPTLERWSNSEGIKTSHDFLYNNEVYTHFSADSQTATIEYRNISFYLGRYMFLKYRVTPEDSNSYTSLKFTLPDGTHNVVGVNFATTDGEWRVILLDLSQYLDSSLIGKMYNNCAISIWHQANFDISYFAFDDEIVNLRSLLGSNECYFVSASGFLSDIVDYQIFNKDGEIVYCLHSNIIYQNTDGSKYHNPFCTDCDSPLDSSPHTFNSDFVCIECDYKCPHSLFNNSDCSVCDFVCGINSEHEIEGTICTRCGADLGIYAIHDDNGFFGLFTSIYDAQAYVFTKLLSYEILGINIANLIVSLIAFVVIIFILKKVL